MEQSSDNDDSGTLDAQNLNKVLEALVNPNCLIKNDVYLDKLFTHLSKLPKLLEKPFIFNFIRKVVDTLGNPELTLNIGIVSFAIKLCALQLENEWQQLKIYHTDILDKIQIALSSNKHLQNPTIKLANVKLMKSLLKHSIGTMNIIKSQSWKTVLNYCFENQTVYVVRESTDFIGLFVFKASTVLNNDALVIEILRSIIHPITSNVFEATDETIIQVDSVNLKATVLPSINLYCHVMEKCIRSAEKTNIIQHICVTFDMRINFFKLMAMTIEIDFLIKIIEGLTYLNYAVLKEERDFNKFGACVFNQMKICISRDSITAFLTVAQLNQRLWDALPIEITSNEVIFQNKPIKFDHQFIIFQLTPMLLVLVEHKMSRIEKSELLKDYVVKLVDMSNEHTIRLCYALRDMFGDSQQISDAAVKAIQGILSMSDGLNRNRAVVVFQSLTHILNDFIDKIDNPTHELLTTPNLLSTILTTIHTLVKQYKITWKESIESVCVLNVILHILNKAPISSRDAVKALKLIQLSIEHFLAPNLALLVDNVNDSGLKVIGPTILKRLHDPNWETRDSALELLTSIADISQLKFPSFQQHILDNNLIPIVIALAKNDSESFVRASALTCLSAMTQVDLLWSKSLRDQDLFTHVMRTLYSEDEGIVRKEAAILITTIWDHRSIPTDKHNLLFSTLAYSATADLHWEVRRSAINFWRSHCRSRFQYQGAIDGGFPSVTFSREKRKIVTLTKNEVTLRLNHILQELADMGALGVYLHCLDDELPILQDIVELIRKFRGFLETYDYINELDLQKESVKITGPTPSLDTHYGEVRHTNSTNFEEPLPLPSDDIIESIVSSQDINLLAESYQYQMTVDSNDGFINEDYYKRFTNITTSEFLEKILTADLDKLVHNRSEWIVKMDSFSSLLNDMLYSFNIDDVNSADCY